MTAGYPGPDSDGSDNFVTGARPGPLPPRTGHPGHATGALSAPAPASQPWPPPADRDPSRPADRYPAQAGERYPAQPATAQYPAAYPPAAQPGPAPGYPAGNASAYPPVSGLPAQAAGYPVSGPPPGAAPPAGYPAPARRSPLVAVLLVVLLLLAVGQGVGLLVLNNRASAEHAARVGAQAKDTKRINDLETRASALEKQAAATLDPQAVAAAVLPSVFKVEAGKFSGTAFVVQAADGSSSLITNYHVVADLYESGGRSVALVHDNQRFTAKIGKVDPDHDVALLTSGNKFPALAVAKEEVATGAPVVVVGAPLGLAQSVTTGVVSAIRADVPGEAGRTYIQFSAPINPGNSGGPVVDARKQVVGIATAKAQDAEGIGLAIPISVACRSLGNC